MPQSISEAAREARARRLAWQQGFVIRKDRARSFNLDHFGGYMLVDASMNAIVAGSRYDLDIEDIEAGSPGKTRSWATARWSAARQWAPQAAIGPCRLEGHGLECEKTGLLKDQCVCDQCTPNPRVFITEYSREYHDRPDYPGIREGHFLAESHGREVHPVRRVTRWKAEAGGLLQHRCPRP